jgi:hypothetical protein
MLAMDSGWPPRMFAFLWGADEMVWEQNEAST